MNLNKREDILAALDTVMLFTLDKGYVKGGDDKLTMAVRDRLLNYLAMSIVTDSLGDEKYVRDNVINVHERLDEAVAKAFASARDFVRKGGLK